MVSVAQVYLAIPVIQVFQDLAATLGTVDYRGIQDFPAKAATVAIQVLDYLATADLAAQQAQAVILVIAACLDIQDIQG